MSSAQSIPMTLPELLADAPIGKTAIILPEQGISISYGGLRDQVQAMAEQLAAAGIGRGDRVATALTNGLPAIVSFLAASVAGTAAPLNPAPSQGHHTGQLLALSSNCFRSLNLYTKHCTCVAVWRPI